MIQIDMFGDIFSFDSKGVWSLTTGASDKWKGKEDVAIPFHKYRELFNFAEKCGYTPEDFRAVRLISDDAKIVPQVRKKRTASSSEDGDTVRVKGEVKLKPKKGFKLFFG
jgi:hypothetical protein